MNNKKTSKETTPTNEILTLLEEHTKAIKELREGIKILSWCMSRFKGAETIH